MQEKTNRKMPRKILPAIRRLAPGPEEEKKGKKMYLIDTRKYDDSFLLAKILEKVDITDEEKKKLFKHFEKPEVVDAEPVVRCKNCKYRFDGEHVHNCCEQLMEKSGWVTEIPVDDNWYCADGERKEDARLIDANEILKSEHQHYNPMADEYYVPVRDIENALTVDAVPLEDYKSMERTVNKLTKALADAELMYSQRLVLRALQKQKDAAEPVVRCKDCEFSAAPEGDSDDIYCTKHPHWISLDGCHLGRKK